MDNAAEALKIAGGILIALITITLLLFVFRNASMKQNEQKSIEEVQRLAEWNAEWEAYNKSYLYASEVYTVLKKAEQNNSEYSDTRYHVEVTVKNKNSVPYPNPMEHLMNDYISTRTTKILKCTIMDDTNGTGRIDTIEFQEID